MVEIVVVALGWTLLLVFSEDENNRGQNTLMAKSKYRDFHCHQSSS